MNKLIALAACALLAACGGPSVLSGDEAIDAALKNSVKFAEQIKNGATLELEPKMIQGGDDGKAVVLYIKSDDVTKATFEPMVMAMVYATKEQLAAIDGKVKLSCSSGSVESGMIIQVNFDNCKII